METGEFEKIYAILDTAADRDYISRKLAARLGIQTEDTWMTLVEAANVSEGYRQTGRIMMESLDGNYKADISDAMIETFPQGSRDLPPSKQD